MIRAILATMAVAATGLLTGPAAATTPAPAPMLTTGSSQLIDAYGISCLSTTMCVMAGTGGAKATGAVSVEKDGVAGAAVAIAHSVGLYSVSCASAAGCVALGRQLPDKGAVFVKVNAAGKITGIVRKSAPAGLLLSTIDCTKPTSCLVAGWDIDHGYGDVGVWNGHNLSLHKIGAIASAVGVEGLSCAGSNCILLIAGQSVAGNIESEVMVHNGKPGKPRSLKTAKTEFGSPTCISSSLCFGIGAKHDFVTLKNGKIVASKSMPGVGGVACENTTQCVGVGTEPDPSQPAISQATIGTVSEISNGKVTSKQAVSQISAYSELTTVGAHGFIAAIGESPQGFSSVTTS